jgi:hypothetical protein
MVYVDTGPGIGAMAEEFEDLEKPLPPQDELAVSENLTGISDAQMAEFRRRAVPQPGNVMRGSVQLSNDARLDIPSTAICTAYSSADYKEGAEQGMTFLAGYNELHNIDWIDLPTGHWPMWSKPVELADILDRIATQAGA